MALLSICIPTYNREAYLVDTIMSIVNQQETDIEIIISDNASTDNTHEKILQLQKKIPFLHYYRNKENLGADINFLNAVDKANGKYCWILGSDDHINVDSISLLRSQIEKYNADIIIASRINCDISMQVLYTQYPLKFENDKFIKLHDNESIKYYLENAIDIFAIFPYLSNFVFRRDLWNNIKCDDNFIGGLYIHAFKILNIIQNGCSLLYMKYPIVKTRLGNDAFKENMAQRILIDVAEYYKLSKIFKDKEIQCKMLDTAKKTKHFTILEFCKSLIDNPEYTQQFIMYTKLYKYNPYKILLLKIGKYTSFRVITFLIRLTNKILKILGIKK